jgi:hypothetical protein
MSDERVRMAVPSDDEPQDEASFEMRVFAVGHLQTMCYAVISNRLRPDGKRPCLVVDPGASGAAIAERLGVKLLDKQILEAVAKKFAIDEETVHKLEARNRSWWDDFTQFYRSYIVDNEYHDLGPELTSHQLLVQMVLIKVSHQMHNLL